jgi:hypothetical protein
MTIGAIDESQRTAARVVGITYLVAMVTSVFSETFVRGRLIVSDDAAETAHRIMAHQLLLRLGIASELITFVGTLVLLTSLYVILRSFGPHLALFAACARLMEAAVCIVMTLTSLDALRVLSGAEYLRAFEPDRLYVLARLSIGQHGAAYNMAFFFLGLGSTAFGVLWLRSRYVPRALAMLGVVGSALLGARALLFVVLPDFEIPLPIYLAPIAVFEVTMGFWLLFKGLPSSERHA